MRTLSLKNRIMLRIYFLYIVRKIRNPFIGEIFIAGILLSVLSFLVSIPSIFANIMLTKGSYAFMFDSFIKTEVIVKFIAVLVLGAVLAFLWSLTVSTKGFIRARFA